MGIGRNHGSEFDEELSIPLPFERMLYACGFPRSV